MGVEVSRDTLGRWLGDDAIAGRYREIVAEVAPRLEEEAVAQARAIMHRAAERERDLLDRLDDREMPPRDVASLASALRNLSTSKALQADKVILPLTGRASTYHGVAADAEANLRALARFGVATVDAEVIEAPASE